MYNGVTVEVVNTDAEGRLIGINSMVVNGLGVAVPASLVHQFVERALSQRAA